jgi:hypothetical protein
MMPEEKRPAQWIGSIYAQDDSVVWYATLCRAGHYIGGADQSPLAP